MIWREGRRGRKWWLVNTHGYMVARVARGRLLRLENVQEDGGNTVTRGSVDMFVIDRVVVISVARHGVKECCMCRCRVRGLWASI